MRLSACTAHTHTARHINSSHRGAQALCYSLGFLTSEAQTRQPREAERFIVSIHYEWCVADRRAGCTISCRLPMSGSPITMVVAAMQGKRRKQLQIDDDDDIEFTVLGQDITTFQQQRQRGQAATSNHQRSNRNEDVARQSGGSTGQQQHTQVHNQQVRRCISGSMVYGTRGLGLFSSAAHCAAKHADAVSCL